MINTAPTHKTIVTEAMLDGLPAPVQRYLRYTGIVGTPWINTAKITYRGKFRMKPDGRWMGMSVEQAYTVDPPGFVWDAHFKIVGLPLLHGVDRFIDGHSHMLGKLLGLITVVEGSGEAIDQGTMIRYAQEAMWFPSAYLTPVFTWYPVDDHAADLVFRYDDREVEARMFFDDDGRILSFIAERYGDFADGQRIETWATPMAEYARYNGLNLPVRGQGIWQLDAGDFTYVDMRLTSVDYNVPVDLTAAR